MGHNESNCHWKTHSSKCLQKETGESPERSRMKRNKYTQEEYMAGNNQTHG